MAQDLRRLIAQKQEDDDTRLYELQKNHSGKNRWTAEAWLAGAEALRTRPEPRFPVIIGTGSMFKTAQELGGFLNTSAVGPATEARAASLDDVLNMVGGVTTTPGQTAGPNEPTPNEPLPAEKSYLISDLNMSQICALEDRTKGERVTIWFHQNPRDAWLPLGLKTEDGQGGGSFGRGDEADTKQGNYLDSAGK
ncbi:hypothetical protein QBC42DRAFT_350248 [Cladorrhinum samala]|uniref:Uncharacterized protein n=1 Tax=Cladorrhinum samala TaxID=585594 RepID=A0AAV9HA81_9PEZI|nr:hypothetical protein QBC42DRAFT_350248 [Cladorrhinum samala]